MKNKILLIIIFSLFICSTQYSQNINGKLGIGGQFIIRDTSNTFLTLNQSNGQVNILRSLRLENTTSSTTGVIFKDALRFLHTYGIENTFLGINSGNFTMTGLGFNTAVGGYSLNMNTTGNQNSAFGNYSLFSNTAGSHNSAFGVQSLYSNSTANNNSAFGYSTLQYNTAGESNSAFGNSSLYSNTNGTSNSAFGNFSLNSNTFGNSNSAFGCFALQFNTTGSNNTAIGYDAQVPSVTASNQVRIGNVGITYAGIQVAWTITSDKRWKSDIQSSNLGLSFINKLKAVTYFRNNDESKKTEYGFIAQDVEEVLKESGIENSGMLTITDEGMYELRYNDLLAPMVKAIQELSEGLLAEKSKNDELKNRNASLEERLAKYELMQNMLVKKMEALESNKNDLKEVKLGEK
jgi:trimeric autotransporter adhesin